MNPAGGAVAAGAAAGSAGGAAPLDVERIRRDFPILSRTVHGRPLVYLDNAATTQKPQVVVEAVRRYYAEQNANVHRGVHWLSQHATDLYEGARETVRRFLNAASTEELVFVRGATEAVNLVAQTFGRTRLQPGDEVVITTMEHHSNIVPWQMICAERGAVLRVAPINDAGELVWEAFENLLNERTKLVAMVHLSNALGTINPVQRVADLCRGRGITTLFDGAQAVSHLAVDVQALGCDFYVLSGHKVFAPTGIGVLYARRPWLEELPPWQGGGDMILSVSFDKTIYNRPPFKFEAGTPHIEGGIGLGAALEYLMQAGLPSVAACEHDLLLYGTDVLAAVPGVRLVGTAADKASILSFVLEGVHPHDIGTILDQEGVAIRTGHHCAQPVLERFGLPATARASLALYNTRQDIDALAAALHKVIRMFR